MDKGYYETLRMSDYWPIKVVPHEYFEDPVYLSEINKNFINGRFMKHWHRSLELFFVVGSGCTVWKNGCVRILHDRDIMVINSEEAHEFYEFQDGPQNGASIFLAYTFLQKLFPEFDNWYFIIDQNHEQFPRLCELILQLKLTAQTENHWKNLKLRSLMYDMLYILTNHFVYQKKDVIDIKTQKYGDRYKMILQYLNEHYKEELSLKMLSSHFGYNPEYFSRSFKEYIGINLIQYIKKLRIAASKVLLLETDLKISDIALEVGEPDIKTFIADFKKEFSITPLQYRKLHKGNNLHEVRPISLRTTLESI